MTAYDRKMRELLGECRSSAFDAKEYSLCDRIDAALAEPSDVHPSHLTDVITLLEDDRDAARAEVEHWKAAAKQHAENHTAAVEEYFRAERERDEARAEVERLKIVLDSIRAARSLLGQLGDHMSDQACEELECILSDEPLNADGELYVTPSQQAYRRGAEAMREAAGVTAFITLFSPDPNRYKELREAVVSAIRALPIPEDKP